MDNSFFTGQVLNADRSVNCTRCGLPTYPNSTAYFDRYQPHPDKPTVGTYVHFDCLSDQRRIEVEREVARRYEHRKNYPV